jgi:glycosyltransferase involved in cell wall biosynthesis
MKVGVNTAITNRGYSGSAKAVEHIVRALDGMDSIDAVRLHPRAARRSSRVRNAAAAAQWDLWGAARSRSDLDLFVSPCNVGASRPGLPHILFLHDTMVLDHPQWFDRGFHYYARLLYPLSAALGPSVVTGSRYSAARMRARWPFLRRISVLRWPAEVNASARRIPPPPYEVVMVAATEPHKNHAAAIDAVRLVRLLTGEDVRLTMVGSHGRSEQYVASIARSADPGGTWLSRKHALTAEAIAEMYRRAWVLLAPSFDEGYCLPLSEAAGWGLPTLHSGRGGMAETLPVGNIGSVSGVDFAHGLMRMLEPATYASASLAVLGVARTTTVDDFRLGLRDVVRRAAGW